MEDEVAVPSGDDQPAKLEKKVRHRKKQLYKTLREQMEFYFGDANLTKDRFLSELVRRDKYVDIAIFLRFNKIRSLTSDIQDIAKALQSSEFLSVTEDGTKVFRLTPIQRKENEEECTIYVEQLPPDADHDWLKDIFSAYGKVVYVSIPKYKPSNKIKGFAFVEFDTPEEASKTLEAFGAVGCRLPTQMPPEQLCSITTFEKSYENKDNEPCVENSKSQLENVSDAENCDSDRLNIKSKRKMRSSDDEMPEEISQNKKKRKEASDYVSTSKEYEEDENSIEISSSGKKRKAKEELKKLGSKESKNKKITRVNDDDNEFEASSSGKKRKAREDSETTGSEQEDEQNNRPEKSYIEDDSGNEGQEQDELEEHKTKKRKKGKDEEEENTTSTIEIENSTEEVVKKKKKRKRKNKKKDKAGDDLSRLGLKILAKREWKRLRNKYLDLQRNKMKAVKQHIAKARWGWNTPQAHSEEGDYSNNRNGSQHNEMQIHQEASSSGPRVTFTPGVIIHVTLDEPITDAKKFKNDVKARGEVQYVDVLEGTNEAYLRLSSSSSAAQFVKEEAFGSMEILKDEEEAKYWEKIKKDREERFGQKVNAKQRGRDKLLKRVERELGKHIRFDE